MSAPQNRPWLVYPVTGAEAWVQSPAHSSFAALVTYKHTHTHLAWCWGGPQDSPFPGEGQASDGGTLSLQRWHRPHGHHHRH